MGKVKIPIVISSCILIMLLITGYLFFRKGTSNSDLPIHTDRGTASASAVSVSPGAITKPTDNSGNYTYIPPTYEYDDNNKNNEEDHMQNNEPTKAPWTPATEMDLDQKSITIYINKEYCLPKDYVPENLVEPNIIFDNTGNKERKLMRVEAAVAIEKLFEAATDDGFTLYGISGYRSYDRQKEIFLNNIVHKGKRHTLKYSAVPGTSEHQSGLAMDVSSKSVRYKLITSFSKCDEGIWLADNAHKFGFIIRYPKDQYNATGYAYEPWHIRYVGDDLANYLYSNNMTLDEYYKYVPNEDFDFEEKYSDLINYVPPITPTPIPEEELEEQIPTEVQGEDLEDNEDLDDEDLDDGEDEDLDGDELNDDLDDDSLEPEDPDPANGESIEDEPDENKNDDIEGNNTESPVSTEDDIDGSDDATTENIITTDDSAASDPNTTPPVNPDADIRN